MDNVTRENFLKVALIAIGAIFFTIHSASFGRQDGSGMVAMANTTCR